MGFKHNPEKVLTALALNNQGAYIAKQPIRIHTPLRFVERGLSVVGIQTFAFGLMPIILQDDTYAVTNICAQVELSPDQTRIITIDDVDYYEFSFEEGSVVYKTNVVVQDDKQIFFVLDELHFQGKMPWFMSMNHAANSLANAGQFADFYGAKNQEVNELLVAIGARSKVDLTKPLRTVAKTSADVRAENIEWVGLNSVYLSVPSTIPKIGGSYFEPAVEGALLQPSKRVDRFEKIMRA